MESESGNWELADNYNTRRIYIVGDAKTVENMIKFVRDIQSRCITYSSASLQAEIFIEALTVVMTLPGDWHASLNMAQAIMNYCYFLDGNVSTRMQARAISRVLGQ